MRKGVVKENSSEHDNQEEEKKKDQSFKTHKSADDIAHLVGCLPSMLKDQGSNPQHCGMGGEKNRQM